ncbi:MAG TPA: hypothetical protein VHW43_06560, partial [Puia sp.]|nr:hypothetical protein [Puia sp.]
METQQPDLIQQAKAYYTDSLSTQLLQPVNPRTSCPRTPQWTGAYTTTTSTGSAVVVPLEYVRPLEIRT